MVYGLGKSLWFCYGGTEESREIKVLTCVNRIWLRFHNPYTRWAACVRQMWSRVRAMAKIDKQKPDLHACDRRRCMGQYDRGRICAIRHFPYFLL